MPQKTFPCAVEQLAYSLYLQRGGDEGDALKDWVEAENRLKNVSSKEAF